MVDAPTDFNFLFHCHEVTGVASNPMCEDQSLLNADAPEFIPTLSHDCPVVGFCEAIPEAMEFCTAVAPLSRGDLAECSPSTAVQRSPQRRSFVSSASSGDEVVCSGTPTSNGSSFTLTLQEFEFGTPTRGSSRSSFCMPAVALQSSAKKTAAARKRCAAVGPGLKCPAMKRTKSEERGEVVKVHTKSEMPELSQEDWENRCATRHRAIEFGKATPEYARYCEARAAGEADESGLMTPDPLDRSVSKRQWKYIVQQWRNELKQRYGSATDGGDTGSTGSVDEGLSVITGVTDEADANSTTCGDDGSSV